MTTTKLLNQVSTKLDSAERCLNTGHLDTAFGYVTDAAFALGRARGLASSWEETHDLRCRLRGVETLVRQAITARIVPL